MRPSLVPAQWWGGVMGLGLPSPDQRLMLETLREAFIVKPTAIVVVVGAAREVAPMYFFMVSGCGYGFMKWRYVANELLLSASPFVILSKRLFYTIIVINTQLFSFVITN